MAYPSVTYTFTNYSAGDAGYLNQNFRDLVAGLSDGTKDLRVSSLVVTGSVTLGAAKVGSWPANTAFAMFGHASLDHSVAGNYALLQQSDGSTFVNAATGKNIALRIGNSDKAIVHGTGRLAIGTSTDDGISLVHAYTASANALNYGMRLTNPNGTDSGGSAVGLLFSIEATGDFGKAAIAQERKNSYARGPIHILLDNTADTSAPTLADAKATFHESGNVSIGSTTDDGANKLQVTGKVKATSFNTGDEDFTYNEDTFTATVTGGGAQSATGTARYVRSGKMVNVTFPSISVVLGAGQDAVITGIPSEIQVARTMVHPASLWIGSAVTPGQLYLESGGTWTLKTASEINVAADGVSVYGIRFASITYNLL